MAKRLIRAVIAVAFVAAALGIVETTVADSSAPVSAAVAAGEPGWGSEPASSGEPGWGFSALGEPGWG